jgi:hypothetical protein
MRQLWSYEIAERLALADPVRYQSKASRAERDRGLDSFEIISIILSQNSQAGGQEWENEGLRVQLLVDTAQSPPRATVVSTTQEKSVTAWSMLLFGNSTTDQSHLSTLSIMLTETHSITKSKTLQYLIGSLTNAYIQDVNSEMGNGGNPAGSVDECNPSLSFINAEMVCLPGVGNVPSGTQWKISADVKQSGRCSHPTVKPIALNIWLCRLLAPPPEYAPRRLLVPFAGSGSEVIAAILSGCWEEVIGIDNNAEYCEIAEARTKWWAGWSQQANTTEPKDILKVGKGQPEPDDKQLELEL